MNNYSYLKNNLFYKIFILFIIILITLVFYYSIINPFLLRNYKTNNNEKEVYYNIHSYFSKEIEINELKFNNTVFNDTFVILKGELYDLKQIKEHIEKLKKDGWSYDMEDENYVIFNNGDNFIILETSDKNIKIKYAYINSKYGWILLKYFN